MFYDLIIIGGGPAGTAAAVYAARKKLKTLLVVAEWGGQSNVSEKIYNWIGTPEIGGMELAENFKKHVMTNVGTDLELKEGEKVTAISSFEKTQDDPEKSEGSKKDSNFEVTLESGNKFETKTILISSGSVRRKLAAKGADELEHKGLTYCASCDGPLFEGQNVAVVGGGNAAFETAAQLLAYCKSVTLFNRSQSFRADEVTVEKVLSNPKMKAVKNVEILEIKGEKFVESLVYKDAEGQKEIPLAGIFVEIGQLPNTSLAKGVVPMNESGQIKIDPRTGKTETEGIWAAGDCTDVLYHQNNIAAGDAVRALEDIYLHLHAK